MSERQQEFELELESLISKYIDLSYDDISESLQYYADKMISQSIMYHSQTTIDV